MADLNNVIRKFRGGYAVTGSLVEDTIRQIKRERLEDMMKCVKPISESQCLHHITFCSKIEVGSLSEAALCSMSQMKIDVSDVIPFDVHLDRAKQNAFVKILWNKGNILRAKHGLEPKDFHITLSALHMNDNEVNHEMSVQDVIASLSKAHLSQRQADHFLFHLIHIKQDYVGALLLLEIMMQDRNFATFDKCAFRLAECLFKMGKHKLCTFACMLVMKARLTNETQDAVYSKTVEMLKKCSKKTQVSCVMTPAEMRDFDEIESSLRQLLLTSCDWNYSAGLLNTLELSETEHDGEIVRSHQGLYGESHTLARYFSWVVLGFLAGMSQPRGESDIRLLERIGIRKVVTLTEETTLDLAWFEGRDIDSMRLPIRNMEAPSVQQVDYFIRLCQEQWHKDRGAILVHCGGSKGRLGTVLACYIALWKCGLPTNDEYAVPVMSAAEAVQWIRRLRPGSIESAVQEAFVAQWVSHRWRQKDKRVQEPLPTPVIVRGTATEKHEHSRVIILVGASGSGKSSWARIYKKNMKNAIVICQDRLGSKQACLEEFKKCVKRHVVVVIDRCNLSIEDRRDWILPGLETTAVEFSYAKELCHQRVADRHDHEVIRPGGGARIVEDQFCQYQPVSLTEGLNQIYQVASSYAADQSIDRLTCELPFFKFPRTRHIVNLGAAAGDDLVLSEHEIETLMSKYKAEQITYEEKVDGANLGISLSGFDLHLLTQNRGHYVNHHTHNQFRKLDEWLNDHRTDLLKVLLTDTEYPRRYVLFGEWMASTHSVHYTRLPDYFIAFDLYDRHLEEFVTRENLEKRLQKTTICLVRQLDVAISKECFRDKSSITALVQQESSYYDGPIEGVYLRFSDENKTHDRAKIVRSDFLASTRHWTSGGGRKNCLQLSNVCTED